MHATMRSGRDFREHQMLPTALKTLLFCCSVVGKAVGGIFLHFLYTFIVGHWYQLKPHITEIMDAGSMYSVPSTSADSAPADLTQRRFQPVLARLNYLDMIRGAFQTPPPSFLRPEEVTCGHSAPQNASQMQLEGTSNHVWKVF